jgi:hypothetical protein
MLQDGTEKYSQLPHNDKTSSYIQGLKFQLTYLASVLELSTGEVPLQLRQQMDLKQLVGMCSGSLLQLHHLEKPFFQLQQAYRLMAVKQTHTILNLVSVCFNINPLNAELNPICQLLALLGAHQILHVSRIRVKKFSVLSTHVREAFIQKCLCVGISCKQGEIDLNLSLHVQWSMTFSLYVIWLHIHSSLHCIQFKMDNCFQLCCSMPTVCSYQDACRGTSKHNSYTFTDF